MRSDVQPPHHVRAKPTFQAPVLAGSPRGEGGSPDGAAIDMLRLLESRKRFADMTERGRDILGTLRGVVSFHLGRHDVSQIAEKVPSMRIRRKPLTIRSS